MNYEEMRRIIEQRGFQRTTVPGAVLGPEELSFLARYASWPKWKRWAWRNFS